MIQKHTILYFNFFFCERKDEYQSDEFQLHGSFYCNLTKELSKCLIEPLKCSQQEFTHGFTRLICSNTLPSRIWFSKIENLIKWDRGRRKIKELTGQDMKKRLTNSLSTEKRTKTISRKKGSAVRPNIGQYYENSEQRKPCIEFVRALAWGREVTNSTSASNSITQEIVSSVH